MKMLAALFWKEWRELWVLPVVAIPLAVMSFFVTKERGEPITPVVFEIVFTLWFVLAAGYIPTHLYTREIDIDTRDFIFAKPLDRFRLWWTRFLIGISVLAAVGIVLYAVMAFLGLFYEQISAYSAQRTEIVRTAIQLGSVFFGLSAFCSVLSKRQINAMMGAVLLFLFSVIVYITVFDKFVAFYRIGAVDEFLIAALVYGPVLLFASLLLFVGKSVQRRTPGRIATAYMISAVATMIPISFGLSSAHHLPRKMKHPTKADQIKVLDVSDNADLILLRKFPEYSLISVDLRSRKIHTIAESGVIDAHLAADKVIFNKFPRFSKILGYDLQVSDIDGSQKKQILQVENRLRNWRPDLGNWSHDSRYYGVVQGDFTELGKKAFVAIWDAHDETLRKYGYSILDDSPIHSIGWDYQSRFYFSKQQSKRGRVQNTYWRVSPKNMEPERILNSFGEDHFSYAYSLSPGGKWLILKDNIPASARHWHRRSWLYNIPDDSIVLLADGNHQYEWSSNGTHIARIEQPLEEDDEVNEKSLPPNLVFHEPATGDRFSVTPRVPGQPLYALYSFSPSGKYLIIFAAKSRNRHFEDLYLFSLETKHTSLLPPVNTEWRYQFHQTWQTRDFVQWIKDDKLLWTAKNKLIVTDFDGSNPKEIFRVEKGEVFIHNEEPN